MAILGIDLGTTNSLVAVIEKGRPHVFRAENGSPLVPSVVGFDGKGEAVEIGAKAKAKLVERWDKTLFSAKRFIGRGKKDVQEWIEQLPFDFSGSDDHMVRFRVGKKDYTPIEVSSLVLKELKRIAEGHLKEKVAQAVITVPAYFNDSQRQATKFAGELSGLDVIRIVNEPTAACLAYGLDKKAKGVVAVFDLGGGTFDISILRVSEGIVEVLATNGDTALGGDDFDQAIAMGIMQKYQMGNSKPTTLSKEQWTHLLIKAEAVKRELTLNHEVAFDFLDKKITASREEMAQWIHPILTRAKKPCLQCLADAKVNPQNITDVILVGGSTRMPVVQAYVKELFGREPICTLDPDLVVAMGAAVQANILAGQLQGMLLLDVIPLSLGIETVGGVVSKLIPRNSTIPISAAEQFSTYVDGQVNVSIHVLQGERELVTDNRSLARFELRGLPPLPAGVPKIEVEFVVDANGILSVRATELRTGKMAEISVNPTYGLNDTEVERMLSESYEHAEADFNTRFLREAQAEADSLIRATTKALSRGRHLIKKAEIDKIEGSVQTLRSSLSATDHKVIRTAIEGLNEATHHLAELILNEAVRGALKGQDLTEEKS